LVTFHAQGSRETGGILEARIKVSKPNQKLPYGSRIEYKADKFDSIFG